MIDAIELPKTSVETPADRLVIGLAQIDCTVGDIDGNLRACAPPAPRRPRSAPIS